MRRFLLAPVLALGLILSGCAGLGSFDPGRAPAPLEQTAVDEKALVLALETFDTVLTSVDILLEAGYIVPGSPRALEIAGNIDRARNALGAASAAQRAGSTSSYLEALEEARAAISLVKSALKPGG